MWTIDRIKNEWLRNHSVNVADHELEKAFNTCHNLLGEEWLLSRWPHEIPKGTPFLELKKNGKSLGPIDYIAPSLNVYHIGKCLGALSGVASADKLILDVGSNLPSAIAELEAIYVLRGDSDREVELYPKLDVAGSEKQPDFRIDAGDKTWIYVEVTHADESNKQKLASKLASSVCQKIFLLDKRERITLLIDREPTEKTEMDEIESKVCDVVEACAKNGTRGYIQLPEDMGFLLISRSLALPTLEITGGSQASGPRICAAQKTAKGQHVEVKVRVLDGRAKSFLKREAAQLSKTEAGLVMISIGNSAAGLKDWRSAIEMKLRNDHSRVGGVVLFKGSITLSNNGAQSTLETNYIKNDRALISLPIWIEEQASQRSEIW